MVAERPGSMEGNLKNSFDAMSHGMGCVQRAGKVCLPPAASFCHFAVLAPQLPQTPPVSQLGGGGGVEDMPRSEVAMGTLLRMVPVLFAQQGDLQTRRQHAIHVLQGNISLMTAPTGSCMQIHCYALSAQRAVPPTCQRQVNVLYAH